MRKPNGGCRKKPNAAPAKMKRCESAKRLNEEVRAAREAETQANAKPGDQAALLAFAPARGRLDPWVSNLGQTTVAAIAVTPFALLLEPVPVAVPAPIAVAAFAWSILVVGLGGYALYFVLLRRLPALLLPEQLR